MCGEDLNQYNIDQKFPDFLLTDSGQDLKEIIRELFILVDKHGLQSQEVKEFMGYHFGINNDNDNVF